MQNAFRSRVRLRHLHSFVAVAQTQHLGRAGEQLGLSQPAISKTLTELEALLGTRLLVRKRSGTELTESGQRFLRHALRVLEDLDEAAGSIDGESERGARRIRIGALPSVVPDLLQEAVLAFRDSHPEVSLAVQTGMNRALIDSLKADLLDIVIGRMDNPAVMEGLWFEMLDAEPLLLAVRRQHALAGPQAGTPTLADVMRFPLVVPAQGSVPRHSAESMLARHGFVLPPGVLETSDAYLGQLIALKSDAVWLAPRCAMRQGLESAELALLPISGHGSEEPVGLLRQGGRNLDHAAEAFVQDLRERAAARARGHAPKARE
ncbi:LysR substrate-binding domain-containing protein [Cupriavidus sp. 2TAF22]|uniref:LysR substrate-binding domain-containing protein n=1 Tax=unclassified Cupriavidus TaxID=2640874 RepID=UPI003F8F2A72